MNMPLSFNEQTELELGDVIWEYADKFIVTKKPVVINDQVFFEAHRVKKDGSLAADTTEFLTTQGLEHYGPKLYKDQEYL